MSPLLRYLSDSTIEELAKRFEPVVVKFGGPCEALSSLTVTSSSLLSKLLQDECPMKPRAGFAVARPHLY